MQKYFSFVAVTFGLLLLGQTALAQNPLKWTFSVKNLGNCQAELIFTGTLDEGWSTYSQYLENEDGPVATSITWPESSVFKPIGKAEESGEILTAYDRVFDMTLTKFKHKAIITQRIEILDPSQPISGIVNAMTCNDDMCLPPRDTPFTFDISGITDCKH